MPYTEKLDYRIGDAVRWRVVNLSYIQHAMHLHGIYFKVVASGNAQPHVRLCRPADGGDSGRATWRNLRDGVDAGASRQLVVSLQYGRAHVADS
jgi:FtsP/CotA-like multicopper oxidase with cupredoxin domain